MVRYPSRNGDYGLITSLLTQINTSEFPNGGLKLSEMEKDNKKYFYNFLVLKNTWTAPSFDFVPDDSLM